MDRSRQADGVAAGTPRLGLCCIFSQQPISFRTTTAAYLSRLGRSGALDKLSEIAVHNAEALSEALKYCVAHGIGCFRISNNILPLRTHAKAGYIPSLLPAGRYVARTFRECGKFAADHGLRTLFHPDQFVVLNSPDPAIVESSVAELEHVAELADWTNADVLILHGGGAYGDKPAAFERFARTVETLPAAVRSRLAIENDERVYDPSEILSLCERTELPFVYDVHHHRCNPDALSVDEATDAAMKTWGNREPLFHISSPLEGWDGPKPARHHDYIDPADFPECWKGLRVTVEVEAKAKELAIFKLRSDLGLPTRG